MSLYNLASGELKKENNELKQEIQRLKGALQTHEILLQSNTKEIERLNNIINNTAVELEILLQSEDFELITMQLRNIVFRLKGSDK